MHVMGHHNIYDVGLLMKSHRHMLVYVCKTGGIKRSISRHQYHVQHLVILYTSIS